MTIPLVRVRYLRDHARAYGRLGGDSDGLVRRLGLNPMVLGSPEALLPLGRLEQLTHHALRDTSLALGWSAAAQQLADLGSFGARLGTAASLYDMLAMLPSAMLSEISGASFFLERRGDQLWICHGPFSGHATLRTHAERFHVQTLFTIIRHWMGPEWLPDELWLQSDRIPEDDQFWPITRIRYGAPVLAVSIPSDVLSTSVDPPTAQLLTPQTVDLYRLDRLDRLDIVEATARVMRTCLPAGEITLVGLSKILGMSMRSFQRRLSEAGTTHTRIMSRVRHQMALERLAQGDYAISDIAQELGYSDCAHFSRAFRRWTGLGPREYRRTSLQH